MDEDQSNTFVLNIDTPGTYPSTRARLSARGRGAGRGRGRGKSGNNANPGRHQHGVKILSAIDGKIVTRKTPSKIRRIELPLWKQRMRAERAEQTTGPKSQGGQTQTQARAQGYDKAKERGTNRSGNRAVRRRLGSIEDESKVPDGNTKSAAASERKVKADSLIGTKSQSPDQVLQATPSIFLTGPHVPVNPTKRKRTSELPHAFTVTSTVPKLERPLKISRVPEQGIELGSDVKIQQSNISLTARTSNTNQQNSQNSKAIAKKSSSSDSKFASVTVEDPKSSSFKSRKHYGQADTQVFHLRPRALSANSIAAPTTGRTSTHLFSSKAFTDLGLADRIIDVLQKPLSEGGFAFKTTTRVQSAAIPMLLGSKSSLIKSETGSGKTLTYLLPMLQDLQSCSPRIERSSGTWSLIIAPTRELCAQIFEVVSKLTHRFAWLVSGVITGGENKKPEKARLRKGIPVLIATPGRLLDHLLTTDSFQCSNLRWLVLDEADRLLDMGFEKQITQILDILMGKTIQQLDEETRSVAASTSDQNENENLSILEETTHNKDDSDELPAQTPYRSSRHWLRRKSLNLKTCQKREHLHSVMVSATLSPAVGKLAVTLLGDHVYVDADDETVEESSTQALLERIANPTAQKAVLRESFHAPEQLQQYAMIVTCKWRLPALVAFLRNHQQHKTIVFLSTCDSVDFHMLLMRETEWPTRLDDRDNEHGNPVVTQSKPLRPLGSRCTGIFGDKFGIFRLHGNVPQTLRQEAYKTFSVAESGVLLCTDVAARGLDLPHVDWILQYDPPVETSDYVHRVGRTARKGACGNALLFLLPSEREYLQTLKNNGLDAKLLSLEKCLRDASQHVAGATGVKNVDEMTAVILQRRFENIVQRSKELSQCARAAFQTFVRAYATHSADTKHIFQVRSLHFGHVAKSFALKDAPSSVRMSGKSLGSSKLREIVTSVTSPQNSNAQNKESGGMLSNTQTKSKRSIHTKRIPAPSGKYRKRSSTEHQATKRRKLSEFGS